MNSTYLYATYKSMPAIPYKIVEYLITNESPECQALWKLIKYTDLYALEHENLTTSERRALLWLGKDKEQDYNIFLKPLIGDSMEQVSQTQIRIYRTSATPNSRFDATFCYEIDMVTNAKSAYVLNSDDIPVERTDYIESLLLNILNGCDLGIGSSFLEFNRNMSRSCTSQLNISNSKDIYGRCTIWALRYVDAEGGGCSGEI